MTVRLAHFSDVHLTARPLGWRPRDALNKRPAGWFNVKVLGRGARFKHANDVAAALRSEFAARGFDQLVFSGDASTLGFPAELREAADRLGVGDESLPPGVAVPGNHDLYINRAVRERHFEQVFAPWQAGRRLTADPYPFERKVGHVWLIALNSSRPNFLFWDATGRVGRRSSGGSATCARLWATARASWSVTTRCSKEGHAVEPRWHRLHDWEPVRDAAAECRINLWLHGHRHRWYYLPPAANLPFPTVCVGSSTQTGAGAITSTRSTDSRSRPVRRVYDPAAGAFADGERFELALG